MVLSLRAGLTLYFARHGETIANVQGRFQGRTTDTPLTPVGLEQAHTLATILAREVTDPATLSYVSSPLWRARKTMEIVLETLGLPRESASVDARLAEIDLGSWDGLTHAEARALDPIAYDARENDKWHVRVLGGGESYADVATRAEQWIGEIGANTFAVSHGAFTRILRGLFAGLTWREMSKLDEPQGCIFRVRGNTVDRLDQT
jgi:probable phosphoglycerate mutase